MNLTAYSRVLAPAHQKSFHLGALHYHFTPTSGSVLLLVLIVVILGGGFVALLKGRG